MGDESEKKPTFSVDAGVLKVHRELDEVEPEEFLAQLKQFAKSETDAPVLDLGDISFLPSYHVNGIREAGDDFVRVGRSLTVCARRNVKKLLERMGLGAAIRLKSTEPEG
jgi:anti-anti-sigma regulatory factor